MSPLPGPNTLSTTAPYYLLNQGPVANSSGHTIVVSRVGRLARNLLVASVLLCAVLILQVAVGAYRSERSSFSDEAAHFMNGLLVRDYIREGGLQNPIEFAKEYYLHYPKIAPAIWPPLFAASAGLFMLLGWPPQTATFVLLALVNAWAAWRLYRFILSFGSPLAAAVLAGVFCVIPAIVDLTTAAMVDLLILALALEATYWLARFFSTGQNRHALLFGVFSTMCCLTKGNGLALALLPPCLAILTRRYDRFAQPGLYIAAAMVAVVAGPPMAFSFRLDAAIGDFGLLHFRDVILRLSYYSEHLRQQLGTFVMGLSLLGFVVAVWQGVRSRQQSDAHLNKAALAALVVAGVAFHLLNPHLVVSHRYIAMVFPPLLGLVAVGIDAIASRIGAESVRRSLQTALLLAAPVTLLAVTPGVAVRRPLGAGATVDFIERAGGLPNSKTIIISDEYGEGALVSEVARRHPMPRATVIRGSKLVATDDWAGNRFRMLYDSPRALLKELEDLHVQYLVMDYSRDAEAVRFWHQVRDLIETNGDRLERMHDASGERRFVTYRLKHQTAGPPKPLEIPLTYSLGVALKQ